MLTRFTIDIEDFIKGKVLRNEPMRRHTSFRTGGPAKLWIEPLDSDDIKSALMAAKDGNMPLFVVGGGTNLLVRDEGINGMVMSMTSPDLKRIYRGDVRVTSGSSVRLSELLRFLRDQNFGGLEFLTGVPGTVGGAVVMNAGCRHYSEKELWRSIGDFVEEVKGYDYNGDRQIFTKNELCFGYRSSNLKEIIVTEVKFLFKKDDKENIIKEGANYLRKKRLTQDLSLPSAGCVFKNPKTPGMSAGELIDKCGLKGMRVGGALISRKHANFILNRGSATSADIMTLIDIALEEVRKRFGIQLELEIQIV